jgi:hypothetical protein
MVQTADTVEEKLKKRYRKISKGLLILALIYSIWVGFLIASIYILGYGYKWMYFTLDNWVLSNIVLLCILVIFEFLFILHYGVVRKRRYKKETPKPVFHNGKQIHMYTLPEGVQGGIFSKTMIPIDDAMTIVIRYQMLQPQELWKKKE